MMAAVLSGRPPAQVVVATRMAAQPMVTALRSSRTARRRNAGNQAVVPPTAHR